ncbi:NAD(P)-binding protein [Daedaleopsis nitida]|nr:NAD(P)-binding protein [Daedaleopsis nitida]
MPSYVVTGASRGIGLEFVRQLSQEKANVVFGAVRNPSTATKLFELQKTAPNVHIIKADLADPSSWKTAAAEVAKVTGGSLDCLINNAAFVSDRYSSLSITQLRKTLDDELVSAFQTNVAGVAHTINAFLPLLRQGATKKVISLSTGLAATDFVLGSGCSFNAQYAISKAALNMLVAEFSAALEGEGFTFLAISPGVVNTAEKLPTPEELEGLKSEVAMFRRYSPDWDGAPLTPETSVKLMRGVIDKIGPKDSGAFVSQHGDQRWL